MRIKSWALSMLIGLTALPLLAQQPRFEVIGRVVRVDSRGDFDLSDRDDFGVEFESKTGGGIGLNLFLARQVSLELSASLVEPDFVLFLPETGREPVTTQGLEMIPLTLGLQLHFLPGRVFDPYVGAGGTYVFFDDIDDLEDLSDHDIDLVEVDDEFGLMLNAGFDIALARHFLINVDAKYLDVEPAVRVRFVRGDFEAARDAEFRPIVISAGVVWRF